MKKLEFFHCSPKKQSEKNFTIYYENHGVFLNTSVVPHYTLWYSIKHSYVKAKHKSYPTTWYIYKVKPNGKIQRGRYKDIICDTATIIEKVGTAKNILRKHKIDCNIPIDCAVARSYNNQDHVDEATWNKIKGA